MAANKIRTLFIGVDGVQAVDSATTLKQILEVEAQCALEQDGRALTWRFFDDPWEPHTIFRSILEDQRLRIDEKRRCQADQPLQWLRKKDRPVSNGAV